MLSFTLEGAGRPGDVGSHGFLSTASRLGEGVRAWRKWVAFVSSEATNILFGPAGHAVEAAPAEAVACAGDWFVLHTMSRQEKAVSADLSAAGVNHVLPLVETVRYYGRRKMKVELPLFPGYVFMRGSIEQAYDADRTRRVANLIRVKDQAGFERELTSVTQAKACGGKLDPHPYLARGVSVEVTAGPFKGLQGVVADIRSGRLVLNVSVLGQATVMEIEPGLLQAMDEPLVVV